MRKSYLWYFSRFSIILCVAVVTASCNKKEKRPALPVTLARIGLYQKGGSFNKRVLIPVSQIGNQKGLSYKLVFDTGSTGMVIDADGLIPASYITSSGFNITGDSASVNGITITKQTGTITYIGGGDETFVYGNLAYATITIGDSQTGTLTSKRIPMFLVYKAVDKNTNKPYPPHTADIFGVGPGVSYTNHAIASPLSYFNLPLGVTNGFKMGLLNRLSFTDAGSLVPEALTIGLLPEDLNGMGGFKMHPLMMLFGTYSTDINANIIYSDTKEVTGAVVVFDTGSVTTEIEDATAPNQAQLPADTKVSITTTGGFNYKYMAGTSGNITFVYNPSFTGDNRSVFGLDFFADNEFLLDYADNKIGLKGN